MGNGSEILNNKGLFRYGWKIAIRRLQNKHDADEATQAAFLSLHEYFTKNQQDFEPAHVRSLIVQQVRWACGGMFRKRRRGAVAPAVKLASREIPDGHVAGRCISCQRRDATEFVCPMTGVRLDAGYCEKCHETDKHWAMQQHTQTVSIHSRWMNDDDTPETTLPIPEHASRRPCEIAQQNERDRLVQGSLRVLTERQRRFITSLHVEGQTQREISEAEGISIQRVSQVIQSAYDKLDRRVAC